MAASNIGPARPEKGRTGLIAVGALAALVAAILIAAGGAMVAVHQTQRDHDGYYTTASRTVTTPTHALVSDRMDIGTGGPDWLFRRSRLGTVRVSATGTRTRPIFVGVARASQVDAYLRGAAYDRVADVEVDPLTVTLKRRPGDLAPTTPGAHDFWVEQASGSGLQTVRWPVQKGAWDVVVMNADATAGVTTNLAVGARAGFIVWVGGGLLAAGGLLVVAAATAIALGLRTPRRPTVTRGEQHA